LKGKPFVVVRAISPESPGRGFKVASPYLWAEGSTWLIPSSDPTHVGAFAIGSAPLRFFDFSKQICQTLMDENSSLPTLHPSQTPPPPNVGASGTRFAPPFDFSKQIRHILMNGYSSLHTLHFSIFNIPVNSKKTRLLNFKCLNL
jgi:hypothetical protein